MSGMNKGRKDKVGDAAIGLKEECVAILVNGNY